MAKHIRFTLEMDGLRSVVDATLPNKYLAMIRAQIISEVNQRFQGDTKQVGEDRFVGKEGGILSGRYPIEEKETKTP